MLFAIKNPDLPNQLDNFFADEKYSIFLAPTIKYKPVKTDKPINRYVPIFPFEKAWTEIRTPDLVMKVPNIVDRNIKQDKE